MTNIEIYNKILLAVADQFCTTPERVKYGTSQAMRKARKVLYQVCAQNMTIDSIAFCSHQRELAIKELLTDETLDVSSDVQTVSFIWNK